MTEIDSSPAASPGNRKAAGFVLLSPQNLFAGLLLIALAVLALWLSADLPRGSLRSAGPGMLPQALAILMILCGLALVGSAFVVKAHDQPRWSLRGPLLVCSAIALFGLTIRPLHPGDEMIPELGLVVSGPLAIIIGGYASPQARLRDLAVLALILTPFCMVLFGDMLNLPIPLLPKALAQSLFADLSYKTSLRLTAACLLVCGVALLLLTRRQTRRPTMVAGHDGAL